METIPLWLWLWAIVCGVLGITIGSKKGRPIVGLLLGLLFGPLGIVFLLLTRRKTTCPYCVAPIHKDAITCPHCRSNIPAGYQEVPTGNSVAMKIAATISIIALTAGVAWLSGLDLSLAGKILSTEKYLEEDGRTPASSGTIDVLSLKLYFYKDSSEAFIHTTLRNNTERVITGIQWRVSFYDEFTKSVWESTPFTRKGAEYLRILPSETKRVVLAYSDSSTFAA
jgi:hypothetical protein